MRSYLLLIQTVLLLYLHDYIIYYNVILYYITFVIYSRVWLIVMRRCTSAAKIVWALSLANMMIRRRCLTLLVLCNTLLFNTFSGRAFLVRVAGVTESRHTEFADLAEFFLLMYLTHEDHKPSRRCDVLVYCDLSMLHSGECCLILIMSLENITTESFKPGAMLTLNLCQHMFKIWFNVERLQHRFIPSSQSP